MVLKHRFQCFVLKHDLGYRPLQRVSGQERPVSPFYSTPGDVVLFLFMAIFIFPVSCVTLSLVFFCQSCIERCSFITLPLFSCLADVETCFKLLLEKCHTEKKTDNVQLRSTFVSLISFELGFHFVSLVQGYFSLHLYSNIISVHIKDQFEALGVI